MKIFNSWGEIVYQSDKIAEGWNGKIEDKPAAAGIYAYWAKGSDQTGKALETRGYFALVRWKKVVENSSGLFSNFGSVWSERAEFVWRPLGTAFPPTLVFS